MVSNVVAAPIISDIPDFNLTRLKAGSWQSEMEFYLPLDQLSADILRSLFDGVIADPLFRDFQAVLDNLSFRRSRGMLQGFIDLVFEHSGRYYILDWKSNHLGQRASDYGQTQMQESMARSAYILQYHLYTLALDRLLRLRLPGYDYDIHFGGAVYIYLRGVTGDGSGSGIYYDRPSPEFIRRASEIMLLN
jgi:exodeoxyribonuclease V beta subunit